MFNIYGQFFDNMMAFVEACSDDGIDHDDRAVND